MKKDFLSINDWSAKELLEVLKISRQMKASPKKFSKALAGKSAALIFEKQSLRTHVTFEIGAKQMGMNTTYLTNADISLGKRETIYDVAKNLERWVDAVVIRTYAQQNVVELAQYGSHVVINALTDQEHPCQAVGDFMTIQEHLKTFKGRKFVWIGDGNNVCHSLMLLAAKLGMNFTAVTPPTHKPDPQVVAKAQEDAKKTGVIVEVIHDPAVGAANADVIYTDVWISMGQEAERETKMQAFRAYQVNANLMKRAKPSAIFLHCLPAHRGEEVTADVIDSPQSAVFDEAENRLHSQKAILYYALKNSKPAKKPRRK
jgi:ornithine carbamoyltransferase